MSEVCTTTNQKEIKLNSSHTGSAGGCRYHSNGVVIGGHEELTKPVKQNFDMSGAFNFAFQGTKFFHH